MFCSRYCFKYCFSFYQLICTKLVFMILVITEKPSVANDFATALGNPVKHDGYIVCGEYFITWAFGHLLKVDDSVYNKGAWTLDSLPILPTGFDYIPIPEKKGQLIKIAKLLKECKTFIVATDAGREGELIAREILIYTKTDTAKGFRFWCSEALSPDVVLRNLKEIKPLSQYDDIYFSAVSRQIADWIVGVNFTRFFSIKAKEIWSVGRVQTPTLALIANRENEIKSFVPQKYFTVTTNQISSTGSSFAGYVIKDKEKDSDRFSESEANRIIASLFPFPFSITCDSVNKEVLNIYPPLLHSLTTLQREANRKHGYTAKQTLDIAQALYEKFKCISYPRSDSNYLGESSLLMANEKLTFFSKGSDVDINRPGKRVFDTSKLTDHHAIIPLSTYNGNNADELNIFNLIVNNFVCCFMKPFTYEQTTLLFKTPQENISICSKGRTVLEYGFKINLKDNIGNDEPLLPSVVQGEICEIIDISKNLKHTEPPKHYTEDTLLSIMNKNGLGTPATRASIIERLFSVSYLIREKKNILSTDKGNELISLLYKFDCPLNSIDITSSWERDLELICFDKENRSGGKKSKDFIESISSFTEDQIKSLSEHSIKIVSPRSATSDMITLAKKLAKEKNIKSYDKENVSFEYTQNFISETLNGNNDSPCPCGSIIRNDKFYYFCTACNKKVPKIICGKSISITTVSKLFVGKSVLIKGLKSKENRLFESNVSLDSNNKLKFNFNTK